MEDQVEEVKRKTDIVGVVGTYVALKKMGRHHKGLCPFHTEKTASFMVNEELGLYKCFGCGAGGDVIKFLMEIEGIEFREALERLAEKAGVKLKTRKFEGADEKRKMLEVLDLSARYFHWLLMEGRSGEKARRYLKERGISSKLWETFSIGFALPGWDNLLNYLVKKKGYKEDLLLRVGLINRKNKGVGYVDKFRGRIMFPLLDAGGKVVGFSGRILPELAKENEPKYLNSPETELYHKGRTLFGFFQAKKYIREKKRAVLVEGQMDLVSSFGAGVAESVAVGGTALTDEQIEMLARLTKTIYLSFDADEAGLMAIKRSVEAAEKRGLEIKVVAIEGGKDPDEIARKYPGKWREMVEGAMDVYEFTIKKAFEGHNPSSPQGIKKITEEVLPFIAKIENSVVRQVWTKKIATRLGIEAEVVKAETDKYALGKTENKTRTISESQTEDRSERLLKRLIGGLLLFPEVRNEVKPWFNDIRVEGAAGKALVYVCGQSKKDYLSLIKEAPAEYRGILEETYLMESEKEMTSKDVLEMAIQCLRENVRGKKKELLEKIDTAQKSGEEGEEERLLEEINSLNREESKILTLLG